MPKTARVVLVWLLLSKEAVERIVDTVGEALAGVLLCQGLLERDKIVVGEKGGERLGIDAEEFAVAGRIGAEAALALDAKLESKFASNFRWGAHAHRRPAAVFFPRFDIAWVVVKLVDANAALVKVIEAA